MSFRGGRVVHFVFLMTTDYTPFGCHGRVKRWRKLCDLSGYERDTLSEHSDQA